MSAKAQPVWRWDHEVLRLHHVVDADTWDLDFTPDLGESERDRFRPYGVDAAEVADTLGPAATAWTREWFADHPDLRVQTWKRDNFGRRLCRLYDPTTGADFASDIITAGQAVRMMRARQA